MVIVIDYGLGNLASIINMMKKAGTRAKISADLQEIEQAEKLILPGVGHFAKGMDNLRSRQMIPLLQKKVAEQQTPLLGICLGMQLLTNHSEEGNCEGLGFVDAGTTKFNFADPAMKVPHMGWNEITTVDHPLFEGLKQPPRFYFVHSYYVKARERAGSIATCEYGHEFDCGIANGKVIGVQFHPEKSHKYGMTLLRNFITNF